MSDQAPKATATVNDVLTAIEATANKHTLGLWLSSVIMAVVIGGGAVYGVLVSQVSDRLKTAQEATDAAVKAASDNEARLQALSDSLAAQSPALKKTLEAKLTALGFKAVTK